MKKLFLAVLLFISIASVSHAQMVIGTLENNSAVLTSDKAKMLTAFNANLLKQAQIDGKFTEVGIESIGDKGYFLIFKGSTYKAAFAVTQDGNRLLTTGTITCTTSDCASESFGCIPNFTSCTHCENKGKCTKTISNSNMLE